MNLLHRITAIISKAIILCFMLAVIILGATSSLVRYYTPKIGDYQTQILGQINKLSKGVTIAADAIYGNWQPLQPELVLEDVSLQFSEHDEKVVIEKLALTVDLFLSLLHRQLYFEAIEIKGLKVQLVQSEGGLWGLRSTAQEATQKAQSPRGNTLQTAIKYLWHINNLQMHDVNIEIQPYQQEKIYWPRSSLTLVGSEQQKHWELSIGKQPKQLLQGVFNSQGQPFTKSFEAQAYLTLPSMDVLEYLPFLKQQYQLHSLKAGSTFWLQYQNGQLQGDGSLVINDLEIQGERTWKMQAITSQFAFDINQDTQKLWLADADIVSRNKDLVVKQLLLQRDAQQLQLFVPAINLGQVSDFLQSLELSEKASAALATLNLKGELQDLLVKAPLQKLSEAQISTTIKHGSSQVFQHVPGFSGVNGQVQAKLLSGKVVLDSQEFAIAIDDIFEQALAFNKAQAEVLWDIDWENKQLDLAVNKIQVQHPSVIRANGELFLQVPLVKQEDKAGRLSLAIGFQQGDAKGRKAFIPRLVPDGLQQWLGDNILQGQVLAGSYIFHGPITDNSNEQKISQLWLNIDKASIRFLPEWPSINDIKGEFLLDGLDASITVDSANSKGVALSDIAIKTEDLAQAFSLSLAGTLNTTGKDGINWLNNPGFNAFIDIPWESFAIDKGAMTGSIKSKITFPDNQEPKLELELSSSLQNVELSVKPVDLTIKNIRGPISFSLDKGLQSKNLSMNIFDERLDISIFSRIRQEKMQSDVYFNTRIHSKRMASMLDSPAWQFINGATQVSGSLRLSKQQQLLTINSDLTGLEILLPEPYYKQAAQAKPLQIKTQLSSDALFTEISLGKTLNADIRFGENGLDAAAINLGLGHSELKKGQLIITGQVPKANAEQWLDTVNLLSDGLKSSPQSLQVIIDNLNIGQLQAYAFMLKNAAISLQKKSSVWLLNIEQQLLHGELEIPEAANQQYIADIQHLDLALFSLLASSPSDANNNRQALDFSALPDTAVHIRQLSLADEDYGNWRFLLTTDKKKLQLSQLEGNVRHAKVGPHASLAWHYQGDAPFSQFNADISGNNMAQVLGAWGYPQEIYSETFAFNTDFTWPGGIEDFSIIDTKGQLTIALNKGNFADAKSSGTGALKLISVLNLNNLLRRLKLDFSDLTQSGLSYDRIRGQVSLDNGVFNLSKPLQVKSSSSEMNLQGSINHREQQLDLTLGVTLPFASNLPWIAALAAGLPTAIGVYIISKVMKNQVDTLSSALYGVSGSYSDPQLKFLRMFEKNSKEKN